MRALSDAEGRLVLADTLTYTQKYFTGVDTIFDFATLTGACVTALGSAYAGIWSNDDELAGAVGAKQPAHEEGRRRAWATRELVACPVDCHCVLVLVRACTAPV